MIVYNRENNRETVIVSAGVTYFLTFINNIAYVKGRDAERDYFKNMSCGIFFFHNFIKDVKRL